MLAPLASMVIPGSQYSNFTFNTFIVVILFLGNREYKQRLLLLLLLFSLLPLLPTKLLFVFA